MWKMGERGVGSRIGRRKEGYSGEQKESATETATAYI